MKNSFACCPRMITLRMRVAILSGRETFGDVDVAMTEARRVNSLKGTSYVVVAGFVVLALGFAVFVSVDVVLSKKLISAPHRFAVRTSHVVIRLVPCL